MPYRLVNAFVDMDRLVISLNYPQKDLAQLIAVVGFILQREFALKREQTVRAYSEFGRGDILGGSL